MIISYNQTDKQNKTKKEKSIGKDKNKTKLDKELSFYTKPTSGLKSRNIFLNTYTDSCMDINHFYLSCEI